MAPTAGTLKDPPTGELAADRSVGQAEPEPVGRPGNAWILFAGVLVGSAMVKEVLRGVWQNRAFARARHVSRGEEAFSVAVLVGLLQQVGARVLRYTRPG